MPCTGKRARLLLTKHRARVVRRIPFVIQLFDRTQEDCVLQDMAVKLDPGSKTTGMAIVRIEKPGVIHVVALAELTHRGQQIKMKLMARAAFRRNRRNRKTRYRQPRFLNRTKAPGWLPPSLMHRIYTTMTWASRYRRWYPITELAMERVKFDTQKMQNPEISGVEYQQGTLQGYEVREYLLEKWERKCGYCGRSNVTRFEVDHAIARARGGSDRVSNLVLSCRPCNLAKGTLPIEVFLKNKPEVLARILKKLKTPLHDAAAVNATRNKLLACLCATGLPVETGTGALTKYNRIRMSIPKAHALDATCVGSVKNINHFNRPTLSIKCDGRGRYSRTLVDKYGFPKIYTVRKKRAFGFQTGDTVFLTRPKSMEEHTGRVTIRHSGSFNVDLGKNKVINIPFNYCQRLQAADGYSYTHQ